MRILYRYIQYGHVCLDSSPVWDFYDSSYKLRNSLLKKKKKKINSVQIKNIDDGSKIYIKGMTRNWHTSTLSSISSSLSIYSALGPSMNPACCSIQASVNISPEEEKCPPNIRSAFREFGITFLSDKQPLSDSVMLLMASSLYMLYLRESTC